jgi:DNA topoisomerase-1
MKKLLIVESPAKIKTIAKFLGKDFKIMSTVGHIKDLPARQLGIKMNGTVELEYVVLENKGKVIADICKEAHGAAEVFLAPDPDREGEIIAWHIAQEIAKVLSPSAQMYRITFNEITQSALEQALLEPRAIDANKVAAQQARRVLDRLVGYQVSPILWQKVSKGLSAGRVQSVALRLICDREEEIRHFKPEEYWSVEGIFGADWGKLNAALTHINKKKIDLANQAAVDLILPDLKKAHYFIETIKDTKRQKNAQAPFMTSSLQQAAYNQLGFSVQKTMQIAQKLYEGVHLEDSSTPVALITYMRTDSLRISETAVKQARTFIKDAYGKEYVPNQAITYSGKVKGQDAHEAIRPISVTLTPEKVSRFLDANLAKLYTLIWQRFVACQMKPAIYAQRQVVIEGKPFTFKVTGSTLLFDGFLKVYHEEEEEKEQKVQLPKDLKEKQPVDLTSVLPKQHFTQPPPRFTEASLVKEMERENIGRPSTYATILKTIQARSYTSLDAKKRFVPTDLGMMVTRLLVEHLPKIMNISFTAIMEEDLDKIAQGSLNKDILLKDFYESFEKDLAAFRGGVQRKPVEPTGLSCPSCKQGELLVRFGKAGSFVGCSAFPQCSFTSPFERQEDGSVVLTQEAAPELLKETCALCQKPLRVLTGKYGKFTACSGYPSCRYVYYPTASFPCPTCKGEIIKRGWKGKTFWGCRNYPKCKFSISGDILETTCPQCSSPYLLKKESKEGETLGICPTKDCDYRQNS